MNDRIIGILGGMGPEATANLFMSIIRRTRVEKDQDHYRVIIDSNPKIPDRTAAILGHGESPVDSMIQTGRNLEKMGADVILIPCNTAHYFIEEVQAKINIPILNALEELYRYIKGTYPQVGKVGLLATSGTIKTGLYQRYMKEIQVVCPKEDTQERLVMEAIYGEHGIKRGNTGSYPLELLKSASMELVNQGAQIIIAGCTEVGLTLKPEHISKPLIDPMDVAANLVTDPSINVEERI